MWRKWWGMEVYSFSNCLTTFNLLFFGSIKAQMKLPDNVIWDGAGLTCDCWTGPINLSVRSWFWLSEEMRYWRRLMYNQPCSLSRKLPPKKCATIKVEGHSCCFLTLLCSSSIITCKTSTTCSFLSELFPEHQSYSSLLFLHLTVIWRLSISHDHQGRGKMSFGSCREGVRGWGGGRWWRVLLVSCRTVHTAALTVWCAQVSCWWAAAVLF